MIKTTDLTKSYGKARGVTDLTLHVPEGSCFGFIGPNGAGKSTTIRTLLGLISPTSGRAYIYGLDIVKQNKELLVGSSRISSAGSCCRAQTIPTFFRLPKESSSTFLEVSSCSRSQSLDLSVSEPDLEEIFMHYYES